MFGLELGFELAFEVGFGLGLGSRRLQVCFRRISPVEDGECLAQGGAELDRRAVLGLGLLTATLAAALAAAPTAALLSAVHSSRTFARRARALCLTSLQERNHPTPTRAIAFDFCQEDARGTLFFHQASTRLGAQRRKKGLATGCPLVLPGAQGTRVEPMGRCWSPSSTHQALRRRAKKVGYWFGMSSPPERKSRPSVSSMTMVEGVVIEDTSAPPPPPSKFRQ